MSAEDGEKLNEFVTIAQVSDEISAGYLKSILSQRNIPHLIISYYDSAFDGLFQLYKGWGCIRAPIKYKDEILSILNDIKSEQDKDDPNNNK
ncbi:MAG TPA: hypothetical protein PLW02_09745 [Verrucomicrobiota bacterium]|nr:hypothetical protein [Verrucomicrobiota bacterium]